MKAAITNFFSQTFETRNIFFPSEDPEHSIGKIWRNAIETRNLKEITTFFQKHPSLHLPLDLVNLTILNKEKDGESLIHLAAMKNSIFLLEKLIEAGADVNLRDSLQKTPLMMAASQTSRYLIDAGADVNLQDGHGKTVFFYTLSKYRDLKKAKELIEAGAKVNIQDYSGASPLHELFWNNNLHYRNGVSINEILVLGIDPNLQDASGFTALHKLAQRSSELWRSQDTYQFFNPHEPDSNYQGSHYYECFLTALLAGANPRILDNTGKSVIDILKEEDRGGENQKSIELLTRWIAADTSILQGKSLESLLIRKILLTSNIQFTSNHKLSVIYQNQNINDTLTLPLCSKIEDLFEIIIENTDPNFGFFLKGMKVH